ncbi:aminoglycoside phosphotransferase family protein [Streptomyces kasugaensis]|uniref:Aminoglycoside phosphotransferase family protein n=1 Tax=Streptomyces kasugaensis TaxID=1946 RepID=A0A4V2JHE7_STRKA|nr:aminoglycoside phosphotransferase family protein [Streptomyces kasugaensis]TBO54361.1 aminoglycoside phosphotransferase family protein [Streptomyces kasugaensis]
MSQPPPSPTTPPTPPAPSEPTAHTVRHLLSRALPGESGTRIEPVDEGGEHSTWWVGARYVLRFALDESGSRRQRRERALRDAIRSRLAVRVPISIASGEWAPRLTYTIDTRLPGVSAERQPVSPAGERDLAQLLTGLRALSAEEIAGLGLPTAPPRPLDTLRKAAAAAAARLTADGELDGVADGAHRPPLRTDAPARRTPPAPVAVVHNDLKGEHLLVSDSGRVCGVLDWTDAVLGDPAEDIAGLAISLGAPAAIRAATHAGYEPPVCRRALLLARYDTLIRLADRLYGTDDSPLSLLRTQLARAWRTTPLDSTTPTGSSTPTTSDPTTDIRDGPPA